MRTQTQSQMAANGSWKVGPTIGHGATATVSLATETNSGARFAVKSSPISRSALLQREQRILSSLSSPYIISCLGSDISCESYHLFLEFAAGGALSDLAGLLDEPKIRSFTRQILLGISYLHSNGIAHCDVKGRNVLLCSDGIVKLADFGCARCVGDGDRLVMGTPAFMAPEVVRGEEQGTAGDVWSLGCTVVEMATGKSPWPEASNPIAAIHKISYSGDIPELPEWFSDKGKDFVSNCLKRDLKERGTAEQLLRHPFILEADELCSSWKKGKWVSPKSTMEFALWDSETEEDEEEDEDELESPEVDLQERIRQYESPPANWTWDDSWIDVRRRFDESNETETPEFEFSKGRDNTKCSSSGAAENNWCEAAGLWSESMDVKLEELNSVPFNGTRVEEDETEYVGSRCNNFVNDIINEFQIYYCI